ncbi:hypothetical protein ACHAW5_006970 [Stephanodiscus triporus]|uniref:Protein tweety homolog n=1 Tax=Stephanodiscus triporus TaxID=2934178 RepID=A0ABD3PHX3_9STRA
MDDEDYLGPPYEFTASVKKYTQLPRFGHGSDFTDLFSPNHDDQVDYAAGLVALFVCPIIFFVFWTIMIITFKVMGPANAGFLSGHHFVLPNPEDDEKNIRKRPFRVRVVFLIATGFLMLFLFLLVGKGLTNVNNATDTMSKSLTKIEGMLREADLIKRNLEVVGDESISIRDKAMDALENICPANPNIEQTSGLDIIGIAEQAQTDLTMLADFIEDSLVTLDESLVLISSSAESATSFLESIDFWGWQTKLVVSGLFILPTFFAVGVGLVMMGFDVKPYQKSLSYFFMPLFMMTIIACCIVCCLILPLSAASADACSGGGDVRGGPDDTVLTIYRNLRGDDTGIVFQFVGYYTQQCNPEYNPFGFLDEYLNDLDNAIDSTSTAVSAVEGNQAFLEEQCGSDLPFDDVLTIVKDMNNNLKLLRQQVVRSLDLVKCENINGLYVAAFHDAGCTYSVDGMAWIFASSLVISVCGLIMIMLRSAYYPSEEYPSEEYPSEKDPSENLGMPSGNRQVLQVVEQCLDHTCVAAYGCSSFYGELPDAGHNVK